MGIKGQTNNPNGRPKGVPNKFTSSVKEAFAEAFGTLGGAPALAKWGKENPTDFYKLASKLIPAEVNAAVEGNLTVEIIKFADIEGDEVR